MLKRRLMVRESGLFTHADVVQFQEAGADAILVGEADIGTTIRELLVR